MKYRFITVMHNLKMLSFHNKGIQISKGARISNGSQVLEETFKNELMRYTLGSHSIDEFDGQSYCYIDGTFDEIKDHKTMDLYGTQYTYFYLRELQFFINQLWKLKDNNVYIRDGYLICYDKKISDGRTFKASLSEVFTNTKKSTEPSIFTAEELKSVSEHFEISDSDFDEIEKKYLVIPNDNHFYKKSESTRIDRAGYYILAARARSSIPTKIVYYCTALECLFTTSTTEVNHKIAERVAYLLGDNSDQRKDIFTLIKKAYDVRSKVVHGSLIKIEANDVGLIASRLDDVLRNIFVNHSSIFIDNESELDRWFIDLLFRDK